MRQGEDSLYVSILGPDWVGIWTIRTFSTTFCIIGWLVESSIAYSVLKMVAGRLASKHKFDVLRYNSRGVGRSSGSASFTGFSEAEDLKEVVQHAMKNIQDVQHVLLLVSTATKPSVQGIYPPNCSRVTRMAVCLLPSILF